jgi:iron complex transport system permease protein
VKLSLLFFLLAIAGASLLVGETSLVELARRDPDLARLILVELRLPRLALGLAVGGALGLSGAALQGLLRNPLASPDILGGSAGGALGAVLTAYFLGFGGGAAMALGGVGGAIVALILLLLLAGRGATTTTLILAGVAISAFAAALMNLALALAPSPFALYDIMFWLLGSLRDRGIAQLAVALPPILIGSAMILAARRGIDALVLGEDVAATLGVAVRRTRLLIVAGSGIAIGGAVSATGIIGFVGLVVPHLVRPWVGGRPGAAFVPSAIAGAALLVGADMLTRLPVAGRTLPIGVLTALLGAPFFLHLILRERRAKP